MLTPEDRYYNWEELTSRIEKLFSDVEDVLCFKCKPYGKPHDPDTPYVEQLFNMFDLMYDFAVFHKNKLEQEYSDWLVVQDEEILDDMLDDALSWLYIELDEKRGELVA